MDKNQYHYDFSYSIALENPNLEVAPEDHIEHSFMEWCEIFIARRIFKIDDGRSYNLLLRVPAFRRLGLQVLKLCVLTYGEGVEDKNSGMEKCREHIYCELQALEQTLGGQKKNYLNIIIISLYAIIQRATENITNVQIEDEFAIFHLIYWEIKGQLVNKQKMESIVDDIFLAEQFHRFMYWSKEELLSQLRQKVKPPQEPLTFRAKNGQTSPPHSHMYQSFKQLSMKSDMKAQRKENIYLNNQYTPVMMEGQNWQFQDLNVKKRETNLGTFRKKPQMEGILQQATEMERTWNRNRNGELKIDRNRKDVASIRDEMNQKNNVPQHHEVRQKQFQYQTMRNGRTTLI